MSLVRLKSRRHIALRPVPRCRQGFYRETVFERRDYDSRIRLGRGFSPQRLPSPDALRKDRTRNELSQSSCGTRQAQLAQTFSGERVNDPRTNHHVRPQGELQHDDSTPSPPKHHCGRCGQRCSRPLLRFERKGKCSNHPVRRSALGRNLRRDRRGLGRSGALKHSYRTSFLPPQRVNTSEGI